MHVGTASPSYILCFFCCVFLSFFQYTLDQLVLFMALAAAMRGCVIQVLCPRHSSISSEHLVTAVLVTQQLLACQFYSGEDAGERLTRPEQFVRRSEPWVLTCRPAPKPSGKGAERADGE